MVRENVLVAFFSLNGITFHSYRPNLMIIVIFFTSLGAIGICQNPDYKSSVENHLKYLNLFKTFSIRGMRKESHLV
jgi:hypothetical protein